MTGITFAELAKRWLDHQADRVETGKKRQSSLESDAARLVHLLAFFGEKDIQRIASEDLLTFQKGGIKSCSPVTVNAQVRLLKTILIYAADKDLIPKVPKVEPLREPRNFVDLPSIPEVRAILSFLPPRTALLVRFLAETGCRKGEAFHLEWNDLRSDASLVIIRRKEGWEAKTERSNRTFPISRPLMAALMAAKVEAENKAEKEGQAPPSLVFLGRGGGRVWDFRKTLAKAIGKANVTRDGAPMHLSPHVLRKCFVTWQKMRGVDDALLQPSIGHVPGSAVTARHYLHLPTEALRRAVLDLATADQGISTDSYSTP